MENSAPRVCGRVMHLCRGMQANACGNAMVWLADEIRLHRHW